MSFQSPLAPRGGCNPLREFPGPFPLLVSIPTRPERRVQPLAIIGRPASFSMFQSPPAPRGGCNARWWSGAVPAGSGFNPHPPREAGATRSTSGCPSRRVPARVSIPTRPERRVQPACNASLAGDMSAFQSPPAPRGGCNSAAGGRAAPEILVSIPTRPERRVQPARTVARRQCRGFNPHPPREAGATYIDLLAQRDSHRRGSFNPHPPREAGATPPRPSA